MMRCTALLCLLAIACASGAVLPISQLLSDQVVLPSNELSPESAWALTQLSEGNVTCKFFCNDEELDESLLQVAGEAKSCVGTFKVFCKGNVTDGFGVFGAKCEGKSTMFAESKKIGICEGAFQSFGKKGFKTSSGKFIKSTKAYGCLGTAISVNSNSSNSISNPAGLMTDGFRPEDAVAVDMALEGEDSVKEGRCNGLSGRFMGVKVGGKCDKHGDKHSDEHGDKRADRTHTDEPLPEEDRPDMPGARRSLAGHHDKHDKKKHSGKGKHHGAGDSEMESDKHHGKHGDKKAHQKLWDSADMTFEDVEDKVQHDMKKAGVELLPHDLPSGSLEGPPKCEITCNGRHTWFGAFFPCFGKLEVDCGSDQSLPPAIAGSQLDVAGPADNGFSFHGTCKGYWSGALFKTCKGFSTAHVEAGDKSVWDFCAGKKAVRMGGKPGKGFFSSSWCKGKDLLVVEKGEDSL